MSDFAQWDHTRQLLPHDATLIRQWTKAYRKGKRAILRMDTMFDAHHCVQTMTRSLVQHVKRTLRAAESGTLVRRPIALTYLWQTPLNHGPFLHPSPRTATGTTDYSRLHCTHPGYCQSPMLWRYYFRHLTGCRRNFVCHGLILIVTTLVGGSLTYKSTRLDAKRIYRYSMHTYQY